MKKTLKGIMSLILTTTLSLTFLCTTIFAETVSNDEVVLLNGIDKINDESVKSLDNGKMLLFNLENGKQKLDIKDVEKKLKKEFKAGLRTEQEVISYFGILKYDGELIPLYVFGKDVEKEDAINAINESKTKYITKSKQEKTALKNNSNAEMEGLSLAASSTSTLSLSDSYTMVASAIGIYSSDAGTNLFYQEYRWYSKGNNGTTNFYYLRKDYQPLGDLHKKWLTLYESKWYKTNYSSTVNFLDPSPTSSSASSVSISIPLGISWSTTFGATYKIAQTFDMANDTVEWKVTNSTYPMQDVNFTQGVYIESSMDNTDPNAEVLDSMVTKVAKPTGEYTYNTNIYCYVNGSTVGWR